MFVAFCNSSSCFIAYIANLLPFLLNYNFLFSHFQICNVSKNVQALMFTSLTINLFFWFLLSVLKAETGLHLYLLQKCLRFNPDATVWKAKQQVLCSLTESLRDVLNYGLFQPATDGHDAKFLEEERLLREYPQSFEKGVPYLEVLFQSHIDTVVKHSREVTQPNCPQMSLLLITAVVQTASDVMASPLKVLT